MNWKFITQNYLLILLFCLGGIDGFSQFSKEKDDPGLASASYFYGPNGKENFRISGNRIALSFAKSMDEKSLSAFFTKHPELKALSLNDIDKVAGFTMVELSPWLKSEEEVQKLIDNIENEQIISSAHPVLIYADGTVQTPTNKIVVKLRKPSDLLYLENDILKYNFSIEKKYEYGDATYLINLNDTRETSTLDMANALYETKQYEAAEPVFIKYMKRFNTNDPFLNYQWSLNNTGSSIQYNGIAGADMNVFNAWGISTGSATIKVAIIDEGVDLNHPDLVANLLPGFDATGQGSGGAPQGNDAHGTACAGIVAASGNNNLGVSGVAYNVKIVPVRIAYGSGSSWVTNDTWISTAIDWAWNQGQADVLSNSWGGGSPSTLINDAIGRAVTQGRANKGAAVLFAAGNNNSAVSYPATNTNTISVIAMSMCNQRKSPSSCDGENWWGSNYGANADIAAPGVKIYTTDISGAAGYDAGDYEATFNGTSSACPNAAGVMALILSVNPNLTYAQARQILESTCEKTGGYAYNANVSGQPNGTWSNDLGYGRVNAFAAVQLASGLSCSGTPSATNVIASHDNLCAPALVTLTLQTAYPLAGTTFQWEESNNGTSFSPINGATNNFYTTTITATKWFRCVISCTGTFTTNALAVNYLDQTIYSYPHTQNFNASTLPCGWTVENTNADNFNWAVRTTGPRSPANGMAYLKNAALAADDWFFSPPLNMQAGTNYAVRFWYRGSSVSLPEKLEVKWGSSNTSAGMTSTALFSNTNINTTTYQVVNSAVISPTSSGNYYVGFRVFSNANMGNLMVDDITFDIVAPCSNPLQGGIISGPSTIQAGNATLSNWTVSGQTGSDLQWQISANNGTSWSDMAGMVTSSINTFIATPGSYLLRVRVGSLNCPDAYSPNFPVTVTPRVGDVFADPIIISSPYGIYMNIGAQSGFTSNYTGPNAQPSNDVYFKITTGACTDTLAVGTCGSGFDTYIHVLDVNGVHLFSVDDTPICGQHAVFYFQTLPNTTYYIVAEGWNNSTGVLGFGTEEFDNPTYTATITPSGSTTICDGSNLTLTASSGATYQWSTGANTASIVITTGGTYSVTVSDVYGCTASSSISVTAYTPTTVWYQDSDNDGYGNVNITQLSCSQPVGYVANSTDCDDNNPGVHTPQNFYVDSDGDGFGSTTTASLCASTPPSGYANNNTDCDDNNGAINAPQTYYVDADGDGFGSTTLALLCSTVAPTGYANNNTDCNDNNSAINAPQTYYVDADGDGYGSTTTALLCSTTAPSGYANNNTDCDDNNSAINIPQLYYVDADGDGYGSTTTAMLCSTTAPSGYANNNTDCDDNNSSVNVPVIWYQDVDGDGYGQIELTTLACTQPSGYVSNNTDCNDNDANVNAYSTFYGDADQDGYGGSVTGSFCLLTPPPFWSVNDDDCNDNNSNIYPGANEICGNNTDDDCDGLIDETCCSISVNGLVTNAMCSDVNDGAINITVSNGTAPYTFVWSNGSSTEDISNIAAGTYTVTVSDNGGCSAVTNFTVAHNNQAPVAPSAINGPSGACRNQTNVVFSVDPIPGATSYLWILPTGASGSSTTNSITLSFSSTYNTGNLCVRAVNACGQSAQFCRQVIRYVNPPATPGTISGLSRGVCPNTNYTYSIAPVNNATSYIWTAPNNASIVSGQGTTSVTVSFNANFGTSGVLSVRSSNCIGNSNLRNLTIQRTPAQPSAITGPTQVCKLQTGVVFSVIDEPFYDYNWVVPSDCTITSGQGTNSITVTWGSNSGTVAVQSVVSCAVSPYRNKSVTAITCGTAPENILDENTAVSYSIYPNPHHGNTSFILNAEKEAGYRIDILNMQGQLVKRYVGSVVKGENIINLNINEVTNGIYYVKYLDSNGLLITSPVIKE